ncbi:TetR/AcrR family transcriptional regulator [Actinocorallia longicatena]|uniref:TetR/AcrR family transcriptional regulator n=1 Tax=Actinocorallia longicatena TaxID=111803 RepID=A0ABP6QAE6_9ACTN
MPVSDQRPYAALHAKGEDRRQRILAVAARHLARHGWRTTTLGQIARETGLSTAGLLHHFQSKAQLLHAVLDARDAYDTARWDPSRNLIEQLESVAERFREAPDLVGMFAVLRMENIDPEAPLHDRFLARYRVAVELVAELIRRGQDEGIYHPDVNPALKAMEIIAFFNGIETSWLLDPTIPLDEAIREYTASLARQLSLPRDMS